MREINRICRTAVDKKLICHFRWEYLITFSNFVNLKRYETGEKSMELLFFM
jgi:hypothetical protein